MRELEVHKRDTLKTLKNIEESNAIQKRFSEYKVEQQSRRATIRASIINSKPETLTLQIPGINKDSNTSN